MDLYERKPLVRIAAPHELHAASIAADLPVYHRQFLAHGYSDA